MITRLTLLVSTSLVLLLLALPAFGQSEDVRIAVYVEGPGFKQARDLVIEQLPKGIDVIEHQTYQQALVRSGLRGPIGYGISARNLRPALMKIVKGANQKAEVKGAIIARVQAGQILLLFITEGEEPDVEEKVPLEDRAIANVLVPVLEPLLPRPEPEPEPEPEEKPPEDDDDDDDDDDGVEYKPFDFSTAVVILRAGYELGGRFLSYDESPTNSANLRPYDAFPISLIAVGAEVYPAATTGIVVLKDIGLTFAYGHAVGLMSGTEDGRDFDTSYNRLSVGLRGRIRTGDKPAPLLGLEGSFGFLNFGLDPTDDAAREIEDQVPAVGYQWLRAGLDAEFDFGPVALGLGFGYRGNLVAGAVYERFSGATIGAIDVGGGLAVRLIDGLRLGLSGSYAYYFYSFEPGPTDLFVAEGASDELVGIQLGLAFAY